MTVTNDFLAFAVGGGALVQSQADWEANADVGTGFQVGTADPAQCNKAWRQSSFVAAAIAQAMLDTLQQNILDNGVIADFEAQFLQLIRTTATGSFVLFGDQKSSGTNGGNPGASGWDTRTIQTVLADPSGLNSGSVIVLSGTTEFVVLAGTYEVAARAPCCANHHMIRLYDVTASAVATTSPTGAAYGTSENAVASGTKAWTWSQLDCVVTTNVTRTFRIDHYTDGTATGDNTGFGSPASISMVPELYTTVKVSKVA